MIADTTWTLEDYLRVNKARLEKSQGYPTTLEDEDMFILTFKVMDTNKDVRIDWWEFITKSSQRILARREKVQHEFHTGHSM